MVYKMESIQKLNFNFIHVALEEFVENLVGQGFDFLYVIDFIEDTGEETYLIKNSFWFGFFCGLGFHRENCFSLHES